ncbi:hypothetical protein B9Z55_001126 [Caenorhabditis nigoni]|uniref:FACT complex subunit SSRP1 n=1 Tax=Caenorhabditis nigoni TaxID=1611254 RepID=A0A2G5VEE3_9PELO|nr:hypothetical protein B9Z55_001126 [Caenorhabditis nigoni]
MSSLEFTGIFTENGGVLTPGTLKIEDTSAIFKSDKAGKTIKISPGDIQNIRWQKLGNRPGIRFGLKDGGSHRFGGLKDADFDKILVVTESSWGLGIEKTDLVIKGWNYGNVQVKGKNVEFSWENNPIFEIPCTNVSQCVANKNEAVLEFHQNENNPISLMEMRFHMPVDPENEDDIDQVEEFKKAVLAYAGLEAETEQPITLLSDILCTTPRGRYDIKVYPTSIALHGKTYDYKIPVKTITRLFLVPHKDGRHVYFVLALNPPIRQGQTRYTYLVFEFVKDDDQEMEIALTDDLKEKYGGQLKSEMDGPLYENVSILFKVVCNLKVTVPGRFIGSSGTPAIQCSHKQNPGLLYPLEKGFLFIHKPVMYIRLEEISSCHFARSDAGTVTRTFDFEIDMKSGQSVMFNAMEKEEQNKLFDYLNKKEIKIRNSQRLEKNQTVDDSSDDEIDPYTNTVKAEGRGRDESDDDDESTDEDYDLDKDIKNQKKDRDSSEGSGSEPDDEYDSGSEKDSSGTGESEPDDENVCPKKKGEFKSEKKSKKEKPEKVVKKGKGKKDKDPNEPKRATTAYFLWFNANRASLKEDGDTVPEVAKKGGAKWKEMSADDKKEWEQKAAQDKIRYENEMKEYKKNGGGSSSVASNPPKKGTSSPSKYKSKEHISDTDDSDDDEPPKQKKSSKEATPTDESDMASDDSD